MTITLAVDQTGPAIELCPVCRHRAPHRPPICDLDRQWIPARLWELRDLHDLLGAALAPGRGAGVRVSGSHDPRLPLRGTVLDYAGPARRHIEGITDRDHDQDGTWSVASVLDSWARDWAAIKGVAVPGRTDVPGLTAWLARTLPWALDNHPAIADFAGETVVMLFGVRAVLALSRAPIYLSDACPSCGLTALRRDVGADVTWCTECQTILAAGHIRQETAA